MIETMLPVVEGVATMVVFTAVMLVAVDVVTAVLAYTSTDDREATESER